MTIVPKHPLGIQTLADVLNALENRTDIQPLRMRELISAVKTISRLLNRPPADLAAVPSILRMALASVHHVQAGMSPKRLANVKSGLAAALNLTTSGSTIPASKLLLPARRTPEWREFLESLETDWQRYMLARLAT